MILIACLFEFDELFPSWMLKLMATAALGIPVVAYLTIFLQPRVYNAWRSLVRELFDFGVHCIITLWDLCSLKSMIRAWRSIRSMPVFPRTKDEWVAFFIFPFKTYILLSYPFSITCIALIRPYHYVRYSEATFAVSMFFVLCLAILLISSLVQAVFCQRGRATQTMVFFLIGCLIFWSFTRWGTTR
jgi:hypothetical protein